MKIAERVSRVKPSATLAIDARAKALKAEGADVISLGLGDLDFPTPENIKEAGIRAIREDQSHYTLVPGIVELRDAIRDTIRADYGLAYTRENILVSCGGKHALYNLFMATLDPGDEVLIPSPYYVSYPDMAALAGAEPVFVPCRLRDGFKLRPEALEAAITPRARMLILNSPSNPTGVFFTREDLLPIAEILRRHPQIMICTDDIYYRMLYGNAQWVNIVMADPTLKDRTFILNGVSKTYAMTGWRIGYVAGDAAVIKAAATIQGQSTSNPSSIAQWAALDAYRGDQGAVRRMLSAFEERCGYVLSRIGELPGVTCPRPEGAFYAFPNVSAYYGKRAGDRVIAGSDDMAAYLLETVHVATVPGKAFGEDRCIRLSYALPIERLKAAFDRLAAGLAALA